MTSTRIHDSQARDIDEAFGERLRAREPLALERFFELTFDPVYRRVRRHVPSEQEAEDLTQDIFLKIHGSLPRFDPQQALLPWVNAITLNRIRDHWRARRMIRAADRDGDSTSFPGAHTEPPESELERNERDEKVKRAVYRLPVSMRSVLLLRIYDGLTFENVARLIRVTPAAARKRYSRALQRLRDDLQLEGARP